MALQVEYMMEYQDPGLRVTEKSAVSTVMDRKKAVVSYQPTPAETSNSPSSASSYEFSQNCGATRNWVLGRYTGLTNRPAKAF